MHRTPLLLAHAAPARPASQSFPLLAKGFRPFFLLAALHAVLIVPAWLGIMRGALAPATYWSPASWHAHEMLFGFVIAVIAGFLLTAVGNWTQRETAIGGSLAGLALLWLAGRLAMSWASALPPVLVALVDIAFIPALVFRLAGPLLAARDRRNFVMLAVLGSLGGANVIVHLAALGVLAPEAASRAQHVALDVIVLLILIIAGRVFPMFTRNATGQGAIRSIAWLDRACVATMAGLTVVDAFAPQARAAAWLAGAAGILAAARAVHWGARHSLAAPLLWILHAGYGWLVLGLLLRAAAGVVGFAIGSAAVHALTVGAIGSLTLGMMARVSLGHTGRMLVAPRPMSLAFASLLLAAAARVLVPLLAPALYWHGLLLSGALWVIGFATFLACYAAPLLQARVDGKAG